MIAGPSGVGKGSVVRRVLELVPDLYLSVSATTREPRASERPGQDYVFVSDEEFERMTADGELLEWASVFGNRYGTPAEPIQRTLEEGRDALLEIDVQGAETVRSVMGDAVLILLEPPSLAELANRLRSRGTEDEGKIRMRLAEAERELARRELFDHVVVNDDLDRASLQVAAIIASFPERTAPEV